MMVLEFCFVLPDPALRGGVFSCGSILPIKTQHLGQIRCRFKNMAFAYFADRLKVMLALVPPLCGLRDTKRASERRSLLDSGVQPMFVNDALDYARGVFAHLSPFIFVKMTSFLHQ